MEKIVLADQEDLGEFVEVICHHGWLCWTLAQAKQVMNILHTPESLLPQLKLDSNIELLKSSIQMTLKSIWIAQIDGMHLCGEFGDILEMIAKQFAKSAKL